MAQGDVLSSEKREYREPATGVRVVQLTDAPCHNVHPYYNQEGFVDGSGRYVFSSNRSGIGQIYAVEIASGRIVQLTDSDDPPVLAGIENRPGGGAGSGGLTCDPARGRIYYSRGKRVCSLDMETLREEVVAESPPGCGSLGGPDLSSCGRYMVLSCRPEGASAWPWRDESRYRHGSETLVVLCDLQEGRQAVVYHGPSAGKPRRGGQSPVHLPRRPVLPVLRQLHPHPAHGAEDDVVHARRPGAAGAAPGPAADLRSAALRDGQPLLPGAGQPRAVAVVHLHPSTTATASRRARCGAPR